MKIALALFAYGGIAGKTFDALLSEVALAGEAGHEVSLWRAPDDALISRSRSIAATEFLDSGAEVLFMLDHDIEFRPGDLVATCTKAGQTKGLVGGLYACRSFGGGYSSRAPASLGFHEGEDRLWPAELLGAGFLAIHRQALKEIVKRLTGDCAEHLKIRRCLRTRTWTFYDFFRPFTTPSSMIDGAYEYLSEDWAFSARAASVGASVELYSLPRLLHHGDHAYSVRDGITRPQAVTA